jgi:hypothetical protein
VGTCWDQFQYSDRGNGWEQRLPLHIADRSMHPLQVDKLSKITGPICARGDNAHVLSELGPSGQHDWPVMSGIQTGDMN